MPESLEDLIMLQPPTADRPLLGTLILLVEDSRHACEGLRLICQRSGARIRRAESLASAERHLRSYRPRVAVIDLGLPDGSGLHLIETISRAEPRIEVILAISGDDTLAEAALQAGADAFLSKPISSVSSFQKTVLERLPADLQPPQIAKQIPDNVKPDPLALKDDLCLVTELLSSDPDRDTLDYVSAFLASLGKDAGDANLVSLAHEFRTGEMADAGALKAAVQTRIEALQPV